MTDALTNQLRTEIEHLLSLFEHAHLPDHLAAIASVCSDVANEMVSELGVGIEVTEGLRKLLEAKDCFVREAVIAARDAQRRQRNDEIFNRAQPVIDQ